MKRCLRLVAFTGLQRMFADYSVTFAAESFGITGP